MVHTNYDRIFNTLQAYEGYVYAAAHNPEDGEAVLWIKEEESERFVEVSRIKGLWDRICTIGLVNTVKSWFGCGDASFGSVMHFVNQDDVKKELKVRYLNLTHGPSVTQFDQSLALLNNLCVVYNIPRLDLAITPDEKEVQRQKIAEQDQCIAEIRRKYAEEDRVREEANRKQAEERAAQQRQRNLMQDLSPFRPQPVFLPANSGATSYVHMSQEVNGVRTSFSGHFNGSNDVRMENGRVFVNGQPVSNLANQRLV